MTMQNNRFMGAVNDYCYPDLRYLIFFKKGLEKFMAWPGIESVTFDRGSQQSAKYFKHLS